MSEEQAKRKLTAILSADVKGYSRLMADDEEVTVRTINTYREVVTGLIEGHRGRVVDAKGDNILAEFSSVVDAVRCAVQVQKELTERNAELQEHRRMEFRIGINLGDVIEEQGNIYGDGVNVAARLEGLAEGGGICISGTAFDQVKNRISVGYEYQGKQSVKNIPDPVRVYKVLLEPEAAGKVIGEEERRPRKKRLAAIAAVAILVVVAGGLLWNFYLRPDVEPASVEKMAYPLPDKPSIAVLPFEYLSDDPRQEFFSDGLTNQIISSLSKVPRLFVIARNSTSVYKNKPVKIQKVAEDLGIKYVLEGSAQKSGDRIRITAQLIDAITGRHVWSESYDRTLKDIFELQDEITLEIVRAMRVKLTEGEQILLWKKGSTDNIKAYFKALEAMVYVRRMNIEGNVMAHKLSEEAIAMDPNFAAAYTILASAHIMDVWLGTSKSRANSLKTAYQLLQKSIDLEDTLDLPHAFLGYIYNMKRQYDKAIEEGERAIELNPNSADAYVWLANSLRHSGRLDDALISIKKALRLSPFPPSLYLLYLGHIYRDSAMHAEAIIAYEKVVARQPDNLFAHLGLASCYALSDRDKKAAAAASEVLRINPKFSVEHYNKTWPGKDQSIKDRFINSLRKAGLPETPPLPLPDKPSIAVLPFVNMSGDPEQEYFSDGIAEEIITALSKTSKLFVIARTSSFKYKGKEVDVRTVGRELGVGYVLEGSVRKTGDKVRITAQLIDAKTNKHLWAERYDRDLKDIFAVQDEITKKIITALHIEITEGEHARVYAKGTENLNAYLKVMEANWLYQQGSKDGILKARKLAEDAIALDPDYAFAYKTLGSTHLTYAFLRKNPGESIKRAIELFQKAIELDNSLAVAHSGLASCLSFERKYDKAIAEGKLALALDPNSADVIFGYAFLLSMAGEPEEAIPFFKETLRLNPIPTSMHIRLFAIALRDSGQYEEAIAQAKRATEQGPNDLVAWVVLTSSYSLAGREEEARSAAKEILRINPKFSVARYQKVTPQKDRASVKRYCDALRKAGVPD